MSKFDTILSSENLDVVTTIISTVDVPERQKINLIESIANVVYCHEGYFNTLSLDEKIKSITMVALTFSVLLDEEINPYSAKHIMIGISAFNNNIFSAVAGGMDYATN